MNTDPSGSVSAPPEGHCQRENMVITDRDP